MRSREPSPRRPRGPLALPMTVDGARGPVATVLQWSLFVAALGILLAHASFHGAVLGGVLVGVMVIAGVGIATALAPWTRLSSWTAIAMPLVDSAAVALMHHADPAAGYSLLFLIPVTWMSLYFGVVGYVISITVPTVAVITTATIGEASAAPEMWVSFGFVTAAVATAMAALSGQMSAQRALFMEQTSALGRTTRRAQRQEELITEVLDAVDFGVIRIARDGSTTVANEAHARLQQMGNARVPGQPWVFAGDGVTPLDAAVTPYARAARGEVFDNQLVWFGAEQGRRRALSITARRTYGADGSDSGAVVISRDVTSELTALRARDSLVSAVSHELRTPLTSIIGYLELTVDDPDLPARAKNNVDIAERNASRLLEIVSDILMASSRSEMFADLTVSQQAIDVGQILRASGEAWRAAAAERAIDIDLTAIREAPAYADPLRMRQVIDNLVSNAVKYNRDGGRVILSTVSDGMRTSLTIADTGIGLSEESMGRLFERFFRADDRSTGTGLGLAISRDLVRAHGGEISVESRLGAGATFHVSLPATVDALNHPDRGGPFAHPQEATGASGD